MLEASVQCEQPNIHLLTDEIIRCRPNNQIYCTSVYLSPFLTLIKNYTDSSGLSADNYSLAPVYAVSILSNTALCFSLRLFDL